MLNRVLCIDDDRVAIMILKVALARMDFCTELVSFQDAMQALDYLKQEQQEGKPWPELIFLDLNMPNLYGFEFLELLDETFGERALLLKVIVLTSSLDSEDKAKAFTFQSVVDYVLKPVSAGLLERIKNHPGVKKGSAQEKS